jgi:DNA-directed RNA polymerase specialized sigma24 family protein
MTSLPIAVPVPDAAVSDAGEVAAEAALVRDALDGRTAAFDELVRLHGPRVFRFLRRFVRHEQDAEDLTQ